MGLDLYNFTDFQKEHAVEALLELMSQRRFFLRERTAKSGYTTPGLFDSLRQVDSQLRQAYERAQTVAEGYIRQVESEFGFALPELSDGQRVVQCNRYGGGLELCTAWPLARFWKYAPSSHDDLLYEIRMQDIGVYSRAQSSQLADLIWSQMGWLKAADRESKMLIVMLKTRYHADGRFGKEKDLLDEKVSDLQQYAHALGYLLYQATVESHLLDKVRDFWILCSTNQESHVALSHPAFDAKPKIFFDASHMYPYKVHFATVL